MVGHLPFQEPKREHTAEQRILAQVFVGTPTRRDALDVDGRRHALDEVVDLLFVAVQLAREHLRLRHDRQGGEGHDNKQPMILLCHKLLSIRFV